MLNMESGLTPIWIGRRLHEKDYVVLRAMQCRIIEHLKDKRIRFVPRSVVSLGCTTIPWKPIEQMRTYRPLSLTAKKSDNTLARDIVQGLPVTRFSPLEVQPFYFTTFPATDTRKLHLAIQINSKEVLSENSKAEEILEGWDGVTPSSRYSYPHIGIGVLLLANSLNSPPNIPRGVETIVSDAMPETFHLQHVTVEKHRINH